MSRTRILLPAVGLGRFFALLAVCGWARGAVVAGSPQLPEPGSWRLLLEPAFMHPLVSFPISGAESTVLVPGYLGPDGEPQYFSKKDWESLGLTEAAFAERAAQNRTARKVHCELVRDRKRVVQYALIESDDPLTGTMVLAPDFLGKFQDVFGPVILVAVPNRFTVYVFPGLAPDYQSHSGEILREYHESAYPVSVELFEISKKGIRAVGAFDPGA